MELTQELDIINELYYESATCYKQILSATKELESLFKKSLKKFTQRDVEKYFRHLRDKGNSTSTINFKLTYLNKGLKYYQNNLIMPYQRVRNKTKIVITERVFKKLQKHYKETNKELYTFITIAYYTGLRANEILGILQHHITKENNVYFINLYDTKNHSDNLIPVTKKLNNLLENFEEFTISYKQLHYELSKHNITAHQFRHTFITRAYEQGIDSFSIMKLTNQRSMSVHQRYVHHSNKALAATVNRL